MNIQFKIRIIGSVKDCNLSIDKEVERIPNREDRLHFSNDKIMLKFNVNRVFFSMEPGKNTVVLRNCKCIGASFAEMINDLLKIGFTIDPED